MVNLTNEIVKGNQQFFADFAVIPEYCQIRPELTKANNVTNLDFDLAAIQQLIAGIDWMRKFRLQAHRLREVFEVR